MAMNPSIDDKNIDAVAENTSEESGWTAYLEDFSCNNNSFMSSSSLVSDAAWNGSNSIRRLKFNKLNRSNNRRKYTYEYDDDLEDTASSPVNSPKVSTMKQMEVNHRRIDDVASCDFLGQQSSSNNFMKHDREQRNTNNVIDNKSVDEYMELRKRGLCVVPMSALMNYIG
ncbi:hypothetical protein C2S53_020919 [Perilla frutescens var. hirtella]|uniref:Uncharacterized protein n=1 Tax=Perilla frutescens var. hirtella TaxID=608512 RepID=A0AAD4NYS6_PERFH|nr:hypothetical protein C2S53_020919 [Perilla frutescens var. hirtella]